MRSMMVTCDAHFSRYSMCSLDVVKKKRRGIVTHSMHGKRCSRCSKCTDLSHSWRLTGLDALRLEPRPLVVDRHVLTLHPHRVVASQVDALSAVQPTTYRQLLEFHADSARRVAWADAACIRSARVVVMMMMVLMVADDDKVLAVPADIVDAGHGERDVTCISEPRIRMEL